MPSMPTAMSSSILKPVILILPVESGTTPIVFLPASMVCVSASALSMAVVHKADDPVMRKICSAVAFAHETVRNALASASWREALPMTSAHSVSFSPAEALTVIL